MQVVLVNSAYLHLVLSPRKRQRRLVPTDASKDHDGNRSSKLDEYRAAKLLPRSYPFEIPSDGAHAGIWVRP